jgi:hypothetical protein
MNCILNQEHALTTQFSDLLGAVRLTTWLPPPYRTKWSQATGLLTGWFLMMTPAHVRSGHTFFGFSFASHWWRCSNLSLLPRAVPPPFFASAFSRPASSPTIPCPDANLTSAHIAHTPLRTSARNGSLVQYAPGSEPECADKWSQANLAQLTTKKEEILLVCCQIGVANVTFVSKFSSSNLTKACNGTTVPTYLTFGRDRESCCDHLKTYLK